MRRHWTTRVDLSPLDDNIEQKNIRRPDSPKGSLFDSSRAAFPTSAAKKSISGDPGFAAQISRNSSVTPRRACVRLSLFPAKSLKRSRTVSDSILRSGFEHKSCEKAKKKNEKKRDGHYINLLAWICRCAIERSIASSKIEGEIDRPAPPAYHDHTEADGKSQPSQAYGGRHFTVLCPNLYGAR